MNLPCATRSATDARRLAERKKEDEGGRGGWGDDYTVFPRRKVGRAAKASGPGERAPVVLTEDKLRECFNLPLHVASKKMGICITAIKKVCRKFGIHKWPYREMKERKVGVRACSCVCMCVHACACLPACLRKASPGKRAREGWCTGKPGKGWGEKMESRPDEERYLQRLTVLPRRSSFLYFDVLPSCISISVWLCGRTCVCVRACDGLAGRAQEQSAGLQPVRG